MDDSESSKVRGELGISHFVAIQIGNSDLGWWNSDGISSVRMRTTVEKLPLIIHDIGLDIAMFHSWPYIKETYGTTVEQRIAFSKQKAAFVLRKTSESLYGPIHDRELGYFSLATHARTASTFSAEKYLKLWQEFIDDLLSGGPSPTSVPSGPGASPGGAQFPLLSPVDQILRFHHQGGQISRRKLINQLANLAPGNYLLLMSRKRPGTIRARRKLAALFGKKRYKQGLWIIVPFKNYKSNQNYLPFVS
jgi:hypothetical protein